MLLSLLLLIVISVVGVMIAMENSAQRITLTFFTYPVEAPVGLFLLIALGIGILLGILLMVPTILGRSWTSFRQQRKIAELEKKPARKKK